MDTILELIVDAYDCHGDLNDVAGLERVLRNAAKGVGASVVKASSHQFAPHGVTICLILKESHLTLSTWPEHSLAIANIFLCNRSMDASACWEVISKVLKPGHTVFHTVEHKVGRKVKAA